MARREHAAWYYNRSLLCYVNCYISSRHFTARFKGIGRVKCLFLHRCLYEYYRASYGNGNSSKYPCFLNFYAFSIRSSKNIQFDSSKFPCFSEFFQIFLQLLGNAWNFLNIFRTSYGTCMKFRKIKSEKHGNSLEYPIPWEIYYRSSTYSCFLKFSEPCRP